MKSSIGIVLEKDRAIQDDYNYRVVGEHAGLWAIQPIKEMIYNSYDDVAAGLSLDPKKIPIIEPVYWYVKDELLTQFRIKKEQ